MTSGLEELSAVEQIRAVECMHPMAKATVDFLFALVGVGKALLEVEIRNQELRLWEEVRQIMAVVVMEALVPEMVMGEEVDRPSHEYPREESLGSCQPNSELR